MRFENVVCANCGKPMDPRHRPWWDKDAAGNTVHSQCKNKTKNEREGR